MRRRGFCKKYVPGFENAVLSDVGRFVGMRDGRHPVGEYVFSIEDARARPQVPRRGHQADDQDRSIGTTTPNTRSRCRSAASCRRRSTTCILTGASLSFTYDTIFMVMRNFPWCTQTGEIAGFAAARCIGKNILPKELEWTEPYF